MNPLADKQFQLNQTTRDDWAVFAAHRQRVTGLLTQSATGKGSLCVLGAGNCNDIELAALVAAYEEVILVDLDRVALEKGRESQPVSSAERLKYLGGVDVTGCLPRTATWSADTRLEPADFAALAAGTDGSGWPIVEPVDVVASTCLLSQLIGSLDHSLTSQHPQFIEAARSIRTGHFKTIAALLKPGGHCIFISDIVSSDTCPEILTAQDVPRVVENAIRAGNFFTGLNPFVVHKFLSSDPEISPLFEDVSFIPPWVWQCGRRAYAVYAFLASRAALPVK